MTNAPTVVRSYRAYGECRELGIHCIPIGYIEVEEMSDGSFRQASADNESTVDAALEAPDTSESAESAESSEPTEEITETPEELVEASEQPIEETPEETPEETEAPAQEAYPEPTDEPSEASA